MLCRGFVPRPHRSAAVWFPLVLSLTVALGAPVDAATSISRSVLSGGAGGGVGVVHGVRSSLGQSVAGEVESTQHRVRSGFWLPGTGATDVSTGPLPERFRFLAAFPNPFSGETTLTYDVPVSGGRVELRIHDVSGRVVRTLVVGEAVPGRQVVTWDGRDDRGRALAHGLYLCRFEAPGYHRAQKLVRIR